MGLFGGGGIFGKKPPAAEPVVKVTVVPDPVTGKLPPNVLHPKLVAGGIAGLVPLGLALTALITGNLKGTPATLLGIVLPVALALAGVYLAKSPASKFSGAMGQVIEGMQEGFKDPPAKS
jgi:hypothetical protein